MPKLSKTQQQTADKIIKIGQEMKKSNVQIRTALKVAYIESSLGENKGKNPTSSARGVYQYLDGTWKNHEGSRDNDEDSIRAFYQDMQKFEDRYDQHQEERQKNPTGGYLMRSPDNQIPAGVSREEYIYVKHHDGPNAQGDSFKRDGDMEKGINIFRDRANRPNGANEASDDAMRNHKDSPARKVPKRQASIMDYPGMVEVSSYSRNGITVSEHNRTRPDGTVSNNLSYLPKKT
ncbi:MAG: hypothetical protein GC129_00455 [Proteobacteria bacterium]|nr:hypothetical protein [Pseudomonadota bacterium]